MVERKIPSNYQPEFICLVNGVVYRYKAGITTYVPDEVAAIIDNIDSELPKENPPISDNTKAIAENKANIESMKYNQLYTHIVTIKRTGTSETEDVNVRVALICNRRATILDRLDKLKAALGTHKLLSIDGGIGLSLGAPIGVPTGIELDGTTVKISYINGATGAAATYTVDGTSETIADTVVGLF